MSIFNNTYWYAGIIFFILAIGVKLYNKNVAAVWLLFFAALFIRLFMIQLDPFLHDWDEKFHALVARNMMVHPFKPMLKTEILVPYDYRPWCCNHIWLHKQPLFMWQMALSMKIFGVSEVAMRLPSALMGALMVPMLYRVAVLYTRNSFIAFGVAVLMCCSNFQLEQVSGYTGMDHNDVAFGFYVLASIWAYFEYLRKKNMKWVVLIGLFAGCAILNKWLTGLLVFSGWGINILLNIRNKESRREILHLLLALLVCTVVFLPWQIYIFNAFPEEALYEYNFNTKHIFEAVEGHGGHNEFYFHLFPEYFGKIIWMLVLAGVATSFFVKSFARKNNIAILVYTAAVYIFFSLIVQSKMGSYFFVVGPLCYIYMAVALGQLLRIPYVSKYLYMAAIMVCAYVLIAPAKIQAAHDPESQYRQNKIHNTKVYKNLRSILPPDIDIVMNAGQMEDVELMFYNKGINAFHYCYLEAEFDVLKKMNKKVGIFPIRPGYPVPEYITGYEGTFVIDAEIKPTVQYYR